MDHWTPSGIAVSKSGKLLADAVQRKSYLKCEHGVFILRCTRSDFFGVEHAANTLSSDEQALVALLSDEASTYKQVKPLLDKVLRASRPHWQDTLHTGCVNFNTAYEYRILTMTKCVEHVYPDVTAERCFETWRPYHLPPRLCLFPDGTQTAVWCREDDAMFELCVGLAVLDWPVLLLLELFDALVERDPALYTAHRQWQVAAVVQAHFKKLNKT